MKKICFAGLCLFVLACASIQTSKSLTMDQVIMSPSDYSKTNKLGPELTVKHWKGLENIFNAVRAKYDPAKVEFGLIRVLSSGRKTGGIMFGRRITLDKTKKAAPAKNEKLLAVTLVYGTPFSSLQTDFGTRAATVFKKYGRGIIDIVSKEKEILNDDRVAGVVILFKWTVDEDKIEAIIVTSPKDLCEKLANYYISPQSFLDASTVLGWRKKAFSGKIDVDLKKAL